MKIFLTSDLHLGHDTVARLRGFDSAAEHDEVVCQRWRDTVGSEDLVWVLGDLSLNPNRIAPMLDLPGRKRLIAGNHDRCHPRDRRAQHPATIAAYAAIFEWVGTSARIRHGDLDAVACHFPYEGDSRPDRDDRDVQWRLRDCGTPLLHGHVHSPEVLTFSAAGTPQVHVGLDAWQFTPVDVETLAGVLRSAAHRTGEHDHL